MPLQFNEEEVRGHLIDLGYRDVSQDQLQDFMRDLRRLIRYEEKQKRLQEQNLPHESFVARSSRRRRCRSASISASTSSSFSSYESKEKDDQKREESFGKRHLVTSGYDGAESVMDMKIIHQERSSCLANNSQINERRSKKQDASGDSSTSSSSFVEQVLLRVKFPDESVEERPKSRFPSKPTTSFIRPPIKKPALSNDIRCDPVRLYEYYKAIWDRTNFPGDDWTKEVRWTVRERMMGSRE